MGTKSKTKTITLPTLRKGEVLRGIRFDQKGKPLYHLIELVGNHGKASHPGAAERATKAGYDLPDRPDGRLLDAVGSKITSGWFWLKPQYEANSAYAYAQHFSSGTQDVCRKDDEFAVRLVRSEVIR